MPDFSNIQIQDIALHYTGNKSQEEVLRLSKKKLMIHDEQVLELLLQYFIPPFKSEELYNLHHESDILLNEVYSYVSAIFQDKAIFFEQSVNLAKHLYEQSTHPKIKGGEFYVVYFTGCIIDDEETDAIGLFKSESKETFLKVSPLGDSFDINYEDGININKLDKGCIIYNIDRENGYLASIVDNVNKSVEALYWKDSFLRVMQRQDNYHFTQNCMNVCKGFVTQKLPKEFEVSKADQADFLNKSVQYFKQNEEFDFTNFSKEVFQQPEVIDAFKDYKEQYQTENEVTIADEFNISDQAVKKQSKVFKSIIKLDKNFHIYVHGNRQNIVKGYDEATGMHFYQLFFKEEN
jgi:hypothetical protein